jgi:hypothetical protein
MSHTVVTEVSPQVATDLPWRTELSLLKHFWWCGWIGDFLLHKDDQHDWKEGMERSSLSLWFVSELENVLHFQIPCLKLIRSNFPKADVTTQTPIPLTQLFSVLREFIVWNLFLEKILATPNQFPTETMAFVG